MARRKAHLEPGSNRHHLFFPKRDYTTRLERKFRNLRCMQVDIDIFAHRLLHNQLQNLPLPKPSQADMQRAIDRHEQQACACYE